MTEEQYKKKIIEYFKREGYRSSTSRAAGGARLLIRNASQEDWELMAKVILIASQQGDTGMEDFDKRMLTEQEFKDFYELNL